MEKKLVGLYVPAARERFDLLVPAELGIGALTRLLADGAAELSEGRFVPSGEELLVMRQPDLVLDPARTLADYGLEDGAQLILF